MWATSYTVGPQLYHNTLRGIIVMKGTYFSPLLFWLTFVRVKLFVTMMGVRFNSSPFSFLMISGWIQFDNIVFSVSIFRLQYVKKQNSFLGKWEMKNRGDWKLLRKSNESNSLHSKCIDKSSVLLALLLDDASRRMCFGMSVYPICAMYVSFYRSIMQ